MSLPHAKRHAEWLVEQVSTRHGHEEIENAIASQHWLRSEPASRHIEHELATADKDHAPVGDDHARREVDVIADEQHLTFPDDTVGLERAPDGAARPTDRRNISRRFVTLFISVRHASFPRRSCSRSLDLSRRT
jgi:hypothetical protein